jgi:transposase
VDCQAFGTSRPYRDDEILRIVCWLLPADVTPTYSSWLNQVECWFSILSQQALQGVSFTSPEQLRDAIDRFVKTYNAKAAPFEWTKAVVHATSHKPKYADLCK